MLVDSGTLSTLSFTSIGSVNGQICVGFASLRILMVKGNIGFGGGN